jgi:hypothetical protein
MDWPRYRANEYTNEREAKKRKENIYIHAYNIIVYVRVLSITIQRVCKWPLISESFASSICPSSLHVIELSGMHSFQSQSEIECTSTLHFKTHCVHVQFVVEAKIYKSVQAQKVIAYTRKVL